MGYGLDLDEYSELRMLEELLHRAKRREQGLCDYCGRRGDLPPCKFPDRHRLAVLPVDPEANPPGGGKEEERS